MASPADQRIAEARKEAGATTFASGVKWFLAAAFLGLVAVGTGSHLVSDFRAAPDRWPELADPTRLFPAWDEVAWSAEEAGWPAALVGANDGMLENIADYETALEDRAPLIGLLVPGVNRLVTGWLGGATETVYPGRDGWLFYRPDVDYVTGPGFFASVAEERETNPLPAIIELRDALAERGMQLLVAPAPVKPTIHPHRFSRRFESAPEPAQNPSYGNFLARLGELDIAFADLAGVLWDARDEAEGPLYLRSDTHWSPAGVGIAAKAISAAVTALEPPWAEAPTAFERTFVEVRNIGDIQAMLRYEAAPERATVQAISAAGEGAVLDRAAEVLLLGDSFANIYSQPALGWGTGAGLAEHLAANLGRRVDTLAINDNGSYATRLALARELAQGSDRLAGKRVVVYQFAARELAAGDWRTGVAYR